MNTQPSPLFFGSPDLASIVRRAAQRVPGPAAERSLAAVTAIAGLPLDVRIPDPEPINRPLRLAPGELWCAHCGDTVMLWYDRHNHNAKTHTTCQRCRGGRLIPATQILRPDEYVVQG